MTALARQVSGVIVALLLPTLLPLLLYDAPPPDHANEVVLTKGASGVFNATAIDQILRNMRIETLIVCGVVMNYCVETAVRDAADRGFNVLLATDACAARSEEDHRFAVKILDNAYCRVHGTQTLLERIAATA